MGMSRTEEQWGVRTWKRVRIRKTEAGSIGYLEGDIYTSMCLLSPWCPLSYEEEGRGYKLLPCPR